MSRHRMWFSTSAMLAAAALALAACGSSDDAEDPDGTTGKAESTATGTPLTVFAITAVDTPSASFPGIVAALNASATAINAAGGINGHPIEVESCNGNFDPNQELACARQAVDSEAVAVLAPILVTNAEGSLGVLEEAGLADLGGAAAAPAELMSPIAFPLDAGSFTPAGCLAIAEEGLATKLATLASDIGPIKANADLVAQSAGIAGIEITEQVTLPPAAPDVTSQVQQVLDSGADGVVLFALSNQGGQVLQAAAQLGDAPTFCTADGLLNGSQLGALGAAADNFYVSSTSPPPTATDNEAVTKFVAEMKAEEDSGNADAAITSDVYSSATIRAWASMQAFEQIAGSISGDITRDAFLTALKSSTNVETGIYPPIDFTAPVVPAFPSLYNASVQLLKWDVEKKDFESTDISFDVTKVIPGPPPA